MWEKWLSNDGNYEECLRFVGEFCGFRMGIPDDPDCCVKLSLLLCFMILISSTHRHAHPRLATLPGMANICWSCVRTVTIPMWGIYCDTDMTDVLCEVIHGRCLSSGACDHGTWAPAERSSCLSSGHLTMSSRLLPQLWHRLTQQLLSV